jgi:hypothetical protein
MLFERTITGATQLLWPQEIPLPDAGVNLAWAIQPEDDQGNPIILPERYTNVFNLIILPSKDECAKILQHIKSLRENGLQVEENYWSAFDKFARVTQLLEEAEERADAFEIQKMKKEMHSDEKKLDQVKSFFDSARKKYDAAIEEYENCLGK